MKIQGIPMNPGLEAVLLDLEKLFLLSDSMENLKFSGNIEISEPEKKLEKIPLKPFKGL